MPLDQSIKNFVGLTLFARGTKQHYRFLSYKRGRRVLPSVVPGVIPGIIKDGLIIDMRRSSTRSMAGSRASSRLPFMGGPLRWGIGPLQAPASLFRILAGLGDALFGAGRAGQQRVASLFQMLAGIACPDRTPAVLGSDLGTGHMEQELI